MVGTVKGQASKGFKGVSNLGIDLGHPHAEEIPRGVEGLENKITGGENAFIYI